MIGGGKAAGQGVVAMAGSSGVSAGQRLFGDAGYRIVNGPLHRLGEVPVCGYVTVSGDSTGGRWREHQDDQRSDQQNLQSGQHFANANRSFHRGALLGEPGHSHDHSHRTQQCGDWFPYHHRPPLEPEEPRQPKPFRSRGLTVPAGPNTPSLTCGESTIRQRRRCQC